jgi:hypothetical protein
MQVIVKENGVEIGTMDEFDVRETVRRKEGYIVRAVPGCKWHPSFLALKREATPRTRALVMRDTAGGVLSVTQREELYSGFRRDFTDQPMTVNPITVLRRPGKSAGTDEFGREVFGLVAWRETDRFPRRRYNPDEIRPLFPSELHLRAAVAAAGGAGV